MTPVETLREAARLMRERSEAATPGPWGRDITDALHGRRAVSHNVVSRAWDVATCPGGATPPDGDARERQARHDADHIASWHPSVALAVADWLDGCADRASDRMWSVDALAVARDYLGQT